MKSISLLPALALILAGCGSLVPSTVLRASSLDPLTADPAVLAAYPVLPDGIGLVPGESRLILSGVRDDTGEENRQEYVLIAQDGGYRIDPRDHARLRGQQAALAEWKTGPGMEGSLSIFLAPCRIGDGPSADARYAVDVSFAADGERLPLLRDAPLSDLGIDVEGMPDCRT
ncbi:hypothetical protein [Jannaschia pohangensis]|uniref:Lipoprotein n=1 Tax=Jannaschia pohangensis TaxID=390807 RepID=A0A1I3T4H7_9RHOB|nr:hypothetical protein [Jannaschia pohangensis]SFJ65865.1 hypothetical protein SAMN04488095_3291 [Jannaschia pohangensis]